MSHCSVKRKVKRLGLSGRSPGRGFVAMLGSAHRFSRKVFAIGLSLYVRVPERRVPSAMRVLEVAGLVQDSMVMSSSSVHAWCNEYRAVCYTEMLQHIRRAVRNGAPICVAADGSTRRESFHLSVFVYFFFDDVMERHLLSVHPRAGQDASSIARYVAADLDLIGCSGPVVFSCDGCKVNTGVFNGVNVLLSRDHGYDVQAMVVCDMHVLNLVVNCFVKVRILFNVAALSIDEYSFRLAGGFGVDLIGFPIIRFRSFSSRRVFSALDLRCTRPLISRTLSPSPVPVIDFLQSFCPLVGEHVAV